MKLGKRSGGSRILLLAMGILVFLVFVMPAGALAATQESAGATAKQVRIMDPFGLQTLLVAPVKAPVLAAASVRPPSRPMARPRIVNVPARGNPCTPFTPPGPPAWVPGPPPWAQNG